MIGGIGVRSSIKQETHHLAPPVDDGQHEGRAAPFVPFVEGGTLIHQSLDFERVPRCCC